MTDTLVIFFSRKGQNYLDGKIVNLEKGNTEICAETIAKNVGADLFKIMPLDSYPDDYRECTEVAKAELKAHLRPALKQYLQDISKYKNIYVCGPCWWGTFPMPIFSALEELDFSNKQVMVLVTHEGSGIASCAKDVAQICKGAQIVSSFAIRGGDCKLRQDAVEKWILSNS